MSAEAGPPKTPKGPSGQFPEGPPGSPPPVELSPAKPSPPTGVTVLEGEDPEQLEDRGDRRPDASEAPEDDEPETDSGPDSVTSGPAASASKAPPGPTSGTAPGKPTATEAEVPKQQKETIRISLGSTLRRFPAEYQEIKEQIEKMNLDLNAEFNFDVDLPGSGGTKFTGSSRSITEQELIDNFPKEDGSLDVDDMLSFFQRVAAPAPGLASAPAASPSPADAELALPTPPPPPEEKESDEVRRAREALLTAEGIPPLPSLEDAPPPKTVTPFKRPVPLTPSELERKRRNEVEAKAREETALAERDRLKRKDARTAAAQVGDLRPGQVASFLSPEEAENIKKLQQERARLEAERKAKEEAAHRARGRRGAITSASPSAPKPTVSVAADSSKPTLNLDTKPKTPTIKVAGADDKSSNLDLTFSGEGTSPTPSIKFSGPAGPKPEGPEVGTKKGEDSKPEDRSEEAFSELSWATIGKMFNALFKRLAGPVMDKLGVVKTVLAVPKFLAGATAYAIGGLGELFTKDKEGAKAVKELGRTNMVEGLKDAAAIPISLGTGAVALGKGVVKAARSIKDEVADGMRHLRKWRNGSGKDEPEDPGAGVGTGEPAAPPSDPKLKAEDERSIEGRPFSAVRDDYGRQARPGSDVTPHPRNGSESPTVTPEHDRRVAADAAKPMVPPAPEPAAPAVGPQTPPAGSPTPGPDESSRPKLGR